jgi:hypothetical protein
MPDFGIHFGPLAPSLADQLEGQDCSVEDAESLRHLQLDVDAIVRLKVRGHITRNAALAVEKKIIKALEKIVSLD